jgi:hypothetical protein
MISLKEGKGKVPIWNSTQHEATPYLMVDFPTRIEFDAMYSKHKSQELKDRYWSILNSRVQGKTLADSGKPFGLTRERVRQIEARFQKLVGKKFSTQLEANLSMLSAHRNLIESSLDSAMLEMFPLADDSH